MIFKDKNDIQWDVDITLGIARRLADRKIVDLVDVANFEETVSVLINPVKLLDILWCIVEKQAKEREMDQEAFEDSLDNEAVKRALESVQESVRVFTQALEKNTAKALETSKDKLSEVLQKRADALVEVMEGPELQKKMEQELTEIKSSIIKQIG